MRNSKRLLTSLVLLVCATLGSIGTSSGADPALSLTFAVDTSGSMRGENIKEVRGSIVTVLENLKGSVNYSVVSFSNKAKIEVSQSSRSEDVIESLNGFKPVGRTALYDGLMSALKNTQNSQNSVIIVFSDGEDNSSSASALEAKNAANSFAGMIVLVGLGKTPELLARLTEIKGDRGRIISPESSLALTEELNGILKPFSAEKLEVTSKISSGDQGKFLGIFGVLVISLFIVMLSAAAIIRQRAARKGRMRFLKAYDYQDNELADRSIYVRLLRLPIFLKYVGAQEKNLLAAGMKVGIQNWIYIQFGVFIAASIFLQATSFSGGFALVLSGLGSFGASSLFLRIKRNKKMVAFANELPDILTIIASSLKSGLSFSQAMASVAQESQGEVSLQFRRALTEVQMGRNLTDALQDVAERMDSQDFRWTISALEIQRDVGGNLSEILATTADTIRGRAEIRNEIKALSAEGRLSAYVLVALPLVMLLYLRFTRPDSFKLLFSTTPGLVMMTVVLILMSIGWLWVQKVVKIKLT
jgi:Flp pilus assembly protein TadB/uncharacterized protein YegL